MIVQQDTSRSNFDIICETGMSETRFKAVKARVEKRHSELRIVGSDIHIVIRGDTHRQKQGGHPVAVIKADQQ